MFAKSWLTVFCQFIHIVFNDLRTESKTKDSFNDWGRLHSIEVKNRYLLLFCVEQKFSDVFFSNYLLDIFNLTNYDFSQSVDADWWSSERKELKIWNNCYRWKHFLIIIESDSVRVEFFAQNSKNLPTFINCILYKCCDNLSIELGRIFHGTLK